MVACIHVRVDAYTMATRNVQRSNAARRGAVSMVLEVAEANEAARGLYAAAGFVPVGIRRSYYGAGRHAAILRAPVGTGGAPADVMSNLRPG